VKEKFRHNLKSFLNTTVRNPWILQKKTYNLNALYAISPSISDMNRFVGLTDISSELYSIDVSVSCERIKSKYLAYLK